MRYPECKFPALKLDESEYDDGQGSDYGDGVGDGFCYGDGTGDIDDCYTESGIGCDAKGGSHDGSGDGSGV